VVDLCGRVRGSHLCPRMKLHQRVRQGRLVPLVLNGRCFNCFATDDVASDCHNRSCSGHCALDAFAAMTKATVRVTGWLPGHGRAPDASGA
jgi:hypothetical protein